MPRASSCTIFRITSVALALAAVALTPGSTWAQPVGSIDVMFSTDGGASFQDTATVDDMNTFLMRFYFDNTGSSPGTSAAVTTSLPAGFSHVTGSTRVCLEPTDGEVVCNTDTGQSGAIADAVWSAESLSISPTAGLYGQGTSLTTGLLEIGKPRFVNLHDCHYFNGADRFYTLADPDISATNVSNDADGAAACLGAVGAYGLAGSEVRSLGLLAQRYLNYHECHFNFFSDHIFTSLTGSGTTSSNADAGGYNCAGSVGAHIQHPDSSVTNFDLFGQRYLNLWECRYITGPDLISLDTTFGLGSNTSPTPDAAPACPATLGAYTLNDSDLVALDTLDTTRGRGFVEVEILAASGGGNFDLDGALSAAEISTETDMGTVTVVDVGPSGPNPSVDIQFSHSCGTSFVEMAMPYPGETFYTRIYFDNLGDQAATGASITSTVPAGYTLVPGTTRVCLEPEDGETICNTDPGQGGPIDESAVWNGQDLTIAPTAGVAGEMADATVGFLETGRKRYLNIHECHYYDGFSDRLFLTLAQGSTGTNVSNTVDTSSVCGANAHSRNLVNGVVATYDLLGNRYLNLHECQYQFFFVDRIFLDASDFTGTNTSPTPDTMLSCPPTAGAHSLLPAESRFASFDLAGQRYLNLHECVMLNGADHLAFLASGSNGTNTSQDEDTLVICPSTSGSHSLVTGTVAGLDLLDPTRARGYVEYQVSAAAVTGNFDQTATLTTNEVAAVMDVGQIMAAAGILFKNGFECGNLDMWSASEP